MSIDTKKKTLSEVYQEVEDQKRNNIDLPVLNTNPEAQPTINTDEAKKNSTTVEPVTEASTVSNNPGSNNQLQPSTQVQQEDVQNQGAIHEVQGSDELGSKEAITTAPKSGHSYLMDILQQNKQQSEEEKNRAQEKAKRRQRFQLIGDSLKTLTDVYGSYKGATVEKRTNPIFSKALSDYDRADDEHRAEVRRLRNLAATGGVQALEADRRMQEAIERRNQDQEQYNTSAGLRQQALELDKWYKLNNMYFDIAKFLEDEKYRDEMIKIQKQNANTAEKRADAYDQYQDANVKYIDAKTGKEVSKAELDKIKAEKEAGTNTIPYTVDNIGEIGITPSQETWVYNQITQDASPADIAKSMGYDVYQMEKEDIKKKIVGKQLAELSKHFEGDKDKLLEFLKLAGEKTESDNGVSQEDVDIL